MVWSRRLHDDARPEKVRTGVHAQHTRQPGIGHGGLEDFLHLGVEPLSLIQIVRPMQGRSLDPVLATVCDKLAHVVFGNLDGSCLVSYTHLTLPTIYSV